MIASAYVHSVLTVPGGRYSAKGRTGPFGDLALARRVGWSAGQVGRHVRC